MNIVTKFTVATEQGIETLVMLTKALAAEKYGPVLGQEALDLYTERHLNAKTLIAEINSLANQWLVVYVDQQPAGYARITGKGTRPAILAGKSAIRIADFGVLRQYPDPAVSMALLEKCLSACKPFAYTWLQEYTGSPLIGFWERNGFTRQEEAGTLDGLALASAYWTR